MPNWCENNLTITGKSEDIKQFVTDWNKKDEEGKDIYSWYNVIDIEEEDKNNEGWHYMNNKYIGCKWDLNSDDVYIEFKDGEDSLTASFDSPWGPPDKAIKRASIKYPTLKFEMNSEEGGCDFNYILKCENGETLEERHYSGKDRVIYKIDNDLYNEEVDLENILNIATEFKGKKIFKENDLESKTLNIFDYEKFYIVRYYNSYYLSKEKLEINNWENLFFIYSTEEDLENEGVYDPVVLLTGDLSCLQK